MAPNNDDTVAADAAVADDPQDGALTIVSDPLVPSDIEGSYECQRPVGKVCVCERCEATDSSVAYNTT